MSTSSSTSGPGISSLSTGLTGPLIQFGGLASGLDTTTIIQKLVAVEQQPINQLTTQRALVQAKSTLLQGFQTQLQAVSTALQNLGSVTLFTQTQGVTSSDTTKVLASTATGAGVGSYQIGVSQLANSAQRTFAFTSPSSAGTITIDGHATNVAAGASAQDVATAINTDQNATVYAAAVNTTAADGSTVQSIVFSSRQTGDTGTGFIAVSDGTGSLTEQTALARQGKDAIFTVDGNSMTSHSNVVTSAIPGVSLTLSGITTASGPVSVNVSPPGADPNAITKALQTFVNTYNSAVDAIRAKLTEKTVPNPQTAADQTAGILNGDPTLSAMLDSMRQAIYTPVAGLPSGMQSLADLGISTGAASTTSTQSSLDGDLTIDTTKLQAALTSNPIGVRNLLMGTPTTPGWASTMKTVVDAGSSSSGLLATSISSASATMKDLQTQIDSMNKRLALYQTSLQAQFTALEVAMQQSQTQGQWLTSQLAGLSNNN